MILTANAIHGFKLFEKLAHISNPAACRVFQSLPDPLFGGHDLRDFLRIAGRYLAAVGPGFAGITCADIAFAGDIPTSAIQFCNSGAHI